MKGIMEINLLKCVCMYVCVMYTHVYIERMIAFRHTHTQNHNPSLILGFVPTMCVCLRIIQSVTRMIA